RVLISESSKAYLTKEVDEDNKEGSFLAYKAFCREVAGIISEINPDYPFPNALVSTALEAAHHQWFFSIHLPSLTEVSNGNKLELAEFLKSMIKSSIGVST
ncbi:MAG: TetR/AcrR family transcriptional regulator, partial [Bacteroidota bacterium]